jgi:hypothetical protein
MSSTPLEPFWKFVLNEDSDNDEPVERRRKKVSKGRSAKYEESVTNSNRKVRFQLPRSKSYGDEEEEDDDVSMLELASMDLTPLVDPEPEGRRFLCKKKENRDDDNIWNLLPISSKEDDNGSQRNTRRKSKENREDPAKDNDFLSLIGLSGSQTNEAKRDQVKGPSKGTDDKRDELKRISTTENATNDSFLSMIGLAETNPRHGKQDDISRNSANNNSSIGQKQAKSNGQNRAKQQQADSKGGKANGTSNDKKSKPSTAQKTSTYVASSSSNRDGRFTSSNRSAPHLSEKSSFLSRRKKAPIFPNDNQERSEGTKGKKPNNVKENPYRSTEKMSFRPRGNRKPIFPEEKASNGSMIGFLPTSFLGDSTPAPDIKSNRPSRAARVQRTKKADTQSDIKNRQAKWTTNEEKGQTSQKGEVRPVKTGETKKSVRNRRIKKRDTQTPPTNSNSVSLPVTAVLAAAGVAAIGIAAAGVTATSELFETSPEREQTSYTSQLYEEPKSTNRFWDVFSPSDDESEKSYDRGESSAIYTAPGSGDGSPRSLKPGETSSTYVITQYHLREENEENDYTMENHYDDSSENKISKAYVDFNHSDEPVVALKSNRALHDNTDSRLETKILNSKDHEDFVDDVAARESIYHSDLDENEDFIEHQPASPNQTASPNQPASPKGIGRMACRSLKESEDQGDCFYFEDSNQSESDNPRYVQHDVSLFPALTTVPDISTKTAVVTTEKANQPVEFTSESIEYNNGPRSFYTYDCDATNYACVCYQRYGSPNEIIEISDAPASLRMIDNNGEVIVKIEVSTSRAVLLQYPTELTFGIHTGVYRFVF